MFKHMKIDKKVLLFFSALSDETRLKILTSLSDSEKTVSEIHHALGENKITLSAISHQLKQLQNIDIISSKRKGRKKIYRLSGNFCWCILKRTVKHFNKNNG